MTGDNDIVVRNLYASISRTDVAVYNHGPETGHEVTIGGEFGHEMVSEVVQVGKNVKDIHTGERVYPYPLYAKGDTKRAGTVGGFSEYVLIPDAHIGKQVYLVSDSISSRNACLIEPFTAGIALRYFGCDQVMICDHSYFRLKKAQELGFDICNNGKEDLKEKTMYVFGNAPSRFGPTADIDIWIDAAGSQLILEMYQSIGKIESRMVVVAVLAGMRPVDTLSMTHTVMTYRRACTARLLCIYGID